MRKLKHQGLSKRIWADFFFHLEEQLLSHWLHLKINMGRKQNRSLAIVTRRSTFVTRNCALPLQTSLAELIPDFKHLCFVFDLEEDIAHNIFNLLQWL